MSVRWSVGWSVGPSGRDEPANNLFRVYGLVLTTFGITFMMVTAWGELLLVRTSAYWMEISPTDFPSYCHSLSHIQMTLVLRYICSKYGCSPNCRLSYSASYDPIFVPRLDAHVLLRGIIDCHRTRQ